MSELQVRTKAKEMVGTGIAGKVSMASLTALVPGIQPERRTAGGSGSRVMLRGPSYGVRKSEQDWKALLSDPSPETKEKRRILREQIRAILFANEQAKKEGKSLGEVAAKLAETHRRTIESAWVSILEQNKKKEVTARYLSLFFSNMQDSRKAFRGKVFVIDASAEEIASDTGVDLLERYLSEFADRPDPRASRGFVLVQGWVGTKTALDRLSRIVHKERAVLITDAPCYETIEDLEAASKEGGLLESLPGEDVHHRHTVVIANRGRARHAFKGRFAQEREDVYVPMSGPWFGSYLDNIARGFPWKPAIGYRNPVAGVDGVLLDLRLTDVDGYKLYLEHRLNPCILLSSGSQKVVVWGPDALSKSGKGVQIGVGVVEMILARYAEWIVNQYALLEDLEKADEVVRKKLSEFITLNSGAGRMFRSGSRVSVTPDFEKRVLNVEFDVRFREVVERAVIRVSKPMDKGQRGEVTVSAK